MTGKISIGEVFRATVNTCRANFVTLSLVIIAVMAVPMVLSELYLTPYMNDPILMEGLFINPLTHLQIFGLYLVLILTYFAATLGAIYGSVEAMDGLRPAFGKCLTAGFRGTFPMTLVSILFVLLIFVPLAVLAGAVAFVNISPAMIDPLLAGFGLIVFLLFGYVSIVWFPIMAVIAFERSGPVGSIRRAAQLTKGNRWRLLGLTLIWTLLIVGLSFLTTPVGSLIAGKDFSLLEPKPVGFGDARAIMGSLYMYSITIVMYVLGATFPAAAYFNLREAVDGMSPSGAAVVFE